MDDPVPGLPYIESAVHVRREKARRGALFCISWEHACWGM